MNSLLPQCIDNLEQKWLNTGSNQIQHYDLILDGGAFSGSYTLGCLMYLKELTARKRVQIHRISGTSVGSIMGLLFVADKLEYGNILYKQFFKYYKKNGSLSILKKSIRKVVRTFDKDFYLSCNNRLYISYFDCRNNKHITQYMYSSNKDITNTIIKSSFIPFVLDGKFMHKQKYIDGLYPHIFAKRDGTKRMYIDLTHKIWRMLYIKNEVNNSERILEGILDIHHLLFHEQTKNFCSFVDDWNIVHRGYMYTRKFYTDLYVWILKTYICHCSGYIDTTYIKQLWGYILRYVLSSMCV